MKLIETIIKEASFEETRSGLIFYPDGKARSGRMMGYVIRTDAEKNEAFSFLKKKMICSYAFILSLPLLGFGAFCFLQLALPQIKASASGIISFGVVFFSPLVYRLWYDRRVRKITNGWPKEMGYQTYGQAINNLYLNTHWAMWVLGIIACFGLVLECMLLINLLTILK